MGSPGVFIHFGALGGRLAVFSLAAPAWLPARPPAMTAPPSKALPSRRNRRREAAVMILSMSVGSFIVHPPREIGLSGITKRSSALFQEEGILMVTTKRGGACRGLLGLIRSCPVQQGGQEFPQSALPAQTWKRPRRSDAALSPFATSDLGGGMDASRQFTRKCAFDRPVRGLGIAGPPLPSSTGVLASRPAAGVGRPPFRTSLLG